MLRPLQLMLSAGLCLGFVSLASAQKPNPRTAFLSAEEAGPDFAVQGEYTGVVLLDGASRNVGLQVVARGNGQFIGVLYRGGLPGAGWNRADKIQFTGAATGEMTELKDEANRLNLSIIDGSVSVNESGLNTGQLSKVTRTSPTIGARAPANARIIFDGTNTDEFKNGRIEKGLLMEGADFKNAFKNFKLHLEFRLPYMPYATGQGRSNSGVYLQSRYEVQVLDSFGLEGIENECGALYRYRRPAVNMCLPPLTWQTYDIHFTAAKFDAAGKKSTNARLTVYHNGVAVHDDFEVERKTGAGKKESPELFPIRLQNHGNPVRFRNIWLVEYSDAEVAAGMNKSGCQPVRCCQPVKCCQPVTCCSSKKKLSLNLFGKLFGGLKKRRCR